MWWRASWTWRESAMSGDPGLTLMRAARLHLACSCWIPSANSAGCLDWPIACSWAERWRREGDTISWSRRCSGKPSSWGRTWRISPKSPTSFAPPTPWWKSAGGGSPVPPPGAPPGRVGLPPRENFAEIADEFRAPPALVEVGGAGALAPAVERVLADDGGVGARARECALARRGATARAVAAMREVYRVPRYRPAMPWYLVAWALARVWRWEGRRRQAKYYSWRRKLDVPVISVGNLTMGGTGKTPCVLRLAELLRERGRNPGILTRGYGRTSPTPVLALPLGAAVRTEESGDEPQIFLRARVAPVGIGADRHRAGTLLREKFGADVMLLDDGFQHVKLARDFDVVLLDALNPFGGGEVFPMGRLREPMDALARADAIVITRSEASDLGPAIERAVRHWHPPV